MEPTALEGRPQVNQSAECEHLKDYEESESRSGIDIIKGGSIHDKDQEPVRSPRMKKHSHRHTPTQIEEMER